LRQQRESLVALVEVTQEEQAHLIAFDIQALTDATTRRMSAMAVVAERQHATRQAFDAARLPTDSTVTALAERLADDELGQLASSLRALAGALSELNTLTQVHAKRSSGMTRAYAALLTRGRQGAKVPNAYSRNGRANHAAAAPASIVVRSL